MPWLIAFASGLLPIVWATALNASHGLTEPLPAAVFVAAVVLSMAALSYVTKHLPVSLAYAIFSGSGAAATVAWSMATGAEAVTVLRLLFLAGIIGCTIGLKLHRPHPGHPG